MARKTSILPKANEYYVRSHDSDSSDTSDSDEDVEGINVSGVESRSAGGCLRQNGTQEQLMADAMNSVGKPTETTALLEPQIPCWEESEAQDSESEVIMPQSAEHLLSGFSEYKSRIQDLIMDVEYDPNVGSLCECGREGKLRLYRCFDCVRVDVVCETCLLERHVCCPFHWAERWTGEYFERIDLAFLGLKIHLGHAGRECPSATSEGYDFTIGDVNGIHKCRIVYCACAGKDDVILQLIRYGLFPASVKLPQVAFTFNALRDFHTHTTVSKKSAYDYMIGLRKKTNNFIPSKVKVPSQQFIRIAHYWRFLLAERRSGQLHKVDDTSLSRPRGSFAVVCLACPLPGLNTERDLSPHYKNQKNISVDANFHLIGLNKKNNLHEKALWGGRGYVRKQEDLDMHIKKYGELKEEKSTCSRFHAIDNANMLKHRGQNASGLVMVLCKHGLGEPEGAVNLQYGERHINVDYALAGALKGKELIQRVILSYDIGCQYSVKLIERFEKCFPESVDMIRDMKILVGKLHLFGHIESCQYGFSFNYTDGVGRTDGEEVERWWSEANLVAGSTKQMGPGHRCDTLDDIIGAWNWSKIESLARILARRYKIAQETFDKAKISFESSDSSMRHIYGERLIKQWEGMDTQPYKDSKGEWVSVYRPNLTYPSRAKALENEALKCGDGLHLKARGKTAIFISTGISIQFRQRDLKSKSGLQSLKSARIALEREVKKWRSQQALFMPSVREIVDEHKGDIEDENLWLPSSFTKDERAFHHLEELADIEYKLREGEAYDDLQGLKAALRECSYLESQQNKYGFGKQDKTRTARARKQADNRKWKWANEYRTTRAALVALGMDEADTTLRPLKEEDMYRPSITEPHELGSGGKTDGWVWKMGRKERDSQEWVKEEDRVLWFRSRASQDRWQEEIIIVEEEFKRLIRGFEALSTTWAMAASSMQRSGSLGSSAYASRKKAIYRAMASNARDLFTDCGLLFEEEASASNTVPHNTGVNTHRPLKRKSSPNEPRKRARR